MAVNLRSLIDKMNDIGRRTLEAAAGLCLSRTHYNVEIEHWLIKLLEENNSDLAAILRHFEIDASRLIGNLTSALDKLRTGNSRPPALSPHVVDLAREAWLVASLEHGEQRTRSGHILCDLLADETLARQVLGSAPELEQISVETLSREYYKITANSSEAVDEAEAQVPGEPRAARAGGGKT